MNIFEEKAIGLITDVLKKFAKKFIENKQWSAYFETALSFLKKDENMELVNEQLNDLFSEERIKKLTGIMQNGNGYTFKNTIENELWNVMRELNAPTEEKTWFVSKFMTWLLEYIKSNHPDYYSQYLTDELYSGVKRQLSLIESLKTDLVELKRLITNKNCYLSITDYDFDLKKINKKNLGLSFFESDDKNFIDKFSKALNTETSIFVSGNSRKETLFAVLFELKKQCKEAFVINDEKDWENVRKNCQLKNKVFIPYFLAEYIQSMPNNITIFIYDASLAKRNGVISIDKRKYRFLENKLLDAGYNHDEAYELLQKTHGFFVPLFKRLCENDSYVAKYNYENDDLKCIICALLLGQWTETKGDESIIEILTDMPYLSFVDTIDRYTVGDNPLIYKYVVYGETKYFVTSLEDAWLEFERFLGKSIWNKYLKVLELILFGVDKKYESLAEKNSLFIANNYSNNLKEGVCKSLMTIVFIVKKELSSEVDSMIFKCLDRISTINEWATVSRHITYVSELCPDIFLSRIESELDDERNTGFVDLFKLKTDALFGENYFVNYLWALERLLVQSKYVYRALDLLFKLDALNIRYNISNCPENTLNQVFSPLINVSCIKDMEKVGVLKKYVEKNNNNIKFALKNLPEKSMSLFIDLSMPKYRISEVITETTNEVRYNVAISYLQLCFEQISNNVKIVEELIKRMDSFGSIEITKEFFDKLINSLHKLSDVDLYNIELALRKTIYKHRFFLNSEWRLEENFIKCYEDCLKKIKYKNPYFYFKYLFERQYDFPLLHPVPYDPNNYYKVIEENNKKATLEIQEKIELFKQKKYNLANLISICDSQETTIGLYITKFTNLIYSYDDFKMIIDNQKSNMVLNYYALNVLKNNKSEFFQLVNKLFDIKYDENVTARILSYYPIDDELLHLIDSKTSDSFKKKYWSRDLTLSQEFENYDAIFGYLNHYADGSSYINNLYRFKECLSVDKIYNYATILNTWKNINISFDINYQLYEILKDIKEQKKLTDDAEEVLATLELRFCHILEWNQMYFLKKTLAKNASLYSELVLYMYKNDDGDFHPEHKKYANVVYKMFDQFKFCPGLTGDKFDENVFDDWVLNFKKSLENQRQTRLFSSIMGRLCCYSPIGLDGYPLNEHIREFIENNYTIEMASSFCASECNKRGIYSCTYGEAEHDIANKYKGYADYFRKAYPKCAHLYDMISDNYESQANNERVQSKYER